MTSANQNDKPTDEPAAEEQEPLWRLVPLSDYRPPSSATPEAVRSRLHGLWQRLRGRGPHMDGDGVEEELELPSTRLLDWAAPPPDWGQEDRSGWANELAQWADQEEGAAVQVLVDPPLSVLRTQVEVWAEEQGYTRLPLPSVDALLAGDCAWLDELPLDRSRPVLLSRLERCFLRHHNGLTLLRGLLDRVERDSPKLLVVCNSWAWRYLCQVEAVQGVLGSAKAPTPFGADELAQWFSAAANRSSPYDFTFREAVSGRAVLETNGSDQARGDDPSSYLRHLAARSLGNPHVAWAIWRRSLLAAKSDEVKEKAQDAAENDPGFTLWLRAWADVPHPEMADGVSDWDGMILYALLLHGGMSPDLLTALLPPPANQIRHTLSLLQAGRFVEQVEGEWQVTALGYPSVRDYLLGEGYYVDELGGTKR